MPLHLRKLAAISLVGAVNLACMALGCASSGTSEPFPRFSRTDRPRVPVITAERLQECVETYGGQLSSTEYHVHYRVRVDDEGRVVAVVTNDIPDNAPDFAACTRMALRDMSTGTLSIPLRLGQSSDTTNGQALAMGNALGDLTIAAGAEVTLEEVLAAAGGVNILFAISIGLAISGVTDVVEAVDEWKEIKAQCHVQYAACLGSSLASKFGSVYNATRCEWCREACVRGGGVWPRRVPKAIGFETCQY